MNSIQFSDQIFTLSFHPKVDVSLEGGDDNNLKCCERK